MANWNARAVRSEPVRYRQRAALLHRRERIQDVARLHLGHRQRPECSEDVQLEAVEDVLRGLRLSLVEPG
jgi:hypothetical protein